MSKRIAIIPARGGSKRLPRKNILQINGKPIIYYPISAALESNLFDEVIVSTEDKEIAEIAEQVGASISLRPESLAQDRSTVVEVCNELLSRKGYQYVESFCCIYATAIFLTADDLRESYAKLLEEPLIDYVMGVSAYNFHPVQALINRGGYLESMWPELNKLQSQTYPDLVVSNGTLYWAKTKEFINDKTFYGKNLVGYNLPEDHAVDIDTIDDYNRAVILAKDRL